jgi:hypothetical protein
MILKRTSIARCLQRSKNSGRSDDIICCFHFRIAKYKESTRPVVEIYEKANLLKRIDGSKDIDKVELIKTYFVILIIYFVYKEDDIVMSIFQLLTFSVKIRCD